MIHEATRAFAAGFGESLTLATILVGGLVSTIRHILANWIRQPSAPGKRNADR